MKPSSLVALLSVSAILVITDAVTLGRKPHQHPLFLRSLKPLLQDISSVFIPRQNPFYIYLNVANVHQKCNEKQVCLCYWGNTPDRPYIYEKDLSHLEKEQIRETGYPEIRQAKPKFTFEATPCASYNMDTLITKSERESMLKGFEEAARKIDQPANMFADYIGNFEKQALCFSVKRERASATIEDTLFRVEVQATKDSSSETFRFENEGVIPIQLNTKKAVMQSLTELPTDVAAIFYLTPQICTFTSFNNRKMEMNSRGKLVTEDKFIELVVKADPGCNGDHLLYYDPDELDGTAQVIPHPLTVESYFGTYLTKLNVTDPKEMKKRNMTSSLMPIFEEISTNVESNSII
uniref:Secreted protein n=1 Tax=Panagrellus redivivus TaxID=6233 RepID=A0A7E4UN30_PANRE